MSNLRDFITDSGALAPAAPLPALRTRAELARSLREEADRHRQWADQAEAAARRAAAARAEARRLEEAARLLEGQADPHAGPSPAAPAAQAPAEPEKPREDRMAVRRELAELVQAELTAEEIAQARGVSRSAIDQLLGRHGARARMEGQPKGAEPRPHVGRLLDSAAEPAPTVFPCPECGRECTRRSWQHLKDCAWAHPRQRLIRTLDRLTAAGWTWPEIAEGAGLTRDRLGELRRGAAGTDEEHARIRRLLDEPIPGMPHRGTANSPIRAAAP